MACTSTLATGVNLPAHLVIVVGSRAWRGSGKGYEDIQTSQLLQMIGRAGRPGLDSSGIAVILTDNESRNILQQQMSFGLGPANSNLKSSLPEAMNSEISSLVVQSVDDAVRWLQGTFLFCCMVYRGHSNATIEAQNMCQDAVRQLNELGLVQMSGDNIIVQTGCHIMNKHLLSLDSMKAITTWPSDATLCQILRSLSLVGELHHTVKRNEKKELREIHKTDTVKFKLSKALSKFTVQDESQKAFILLQAIISQHEFQNKTLKQEMSSITNSATKILCAGQEYSIKASKCGKATRLCFLLHRSLMVCLWGVDSGVLNQIDGVGLTCVRMLRFQGIHSFQHVLDSTEDQLEKAAGRRFPFGKELKTTVKDLMRDNLKLSAEIEYTRSSNKPASLVVALKEPSDRTGAARKGDPTVSFTIIAYTDSRTESILFVEEDIGKPISIRVPLSTSSGKIHVAKLASIVGLDESLTLDTDQDVSAASPTVTTGQKNDATSTKRQCKTRQLEISFSAPKRPRMIASVHESTPKDPSPTITPSRTDVLNLQERSEKERHLEPFSIHSGNLSQERTATTTRGQDSSSFAAAFWQRDDSASQSPINVTPHAQARKPQIRQATDNRIHQSASSRLHVHSSDIASTSQNHGLSDFWSTAQHQRNNQPPPIDETSSEVVGNQWKRAQQSASQSQKRAFTGKKENPFRSFSHDPNDSEGRLRNLSHRQQQFSSKQFKRRKDSRLERRAPRMNDREAMKGFAEELERDRQHGQNVPYDRRQSHSYGQSRYTPPFVHQAPPPPPGPPLSDEYSALRDWQLRYTPPNFQGFNREPSRYGWQSPQGAGHQDQYWTPRANYGYDRPPADSFTGPYDRYEPPGSIPHQVQPRLERDSFYYGEDEPQRQRAFRGERNTQMGPPSEIEFHDIDGQFDSFSQCGRKNNEMEPMARHDTTPPFGGAPNTFDDIFF